MKILQLTKFVSMIIFLLIYSHKLSAQDDILDDLLNEDNIITDVFNYGLLINNQTTETTSKGTFQLRVQHRFGELDFKDFGNSVVQEFLGFDGSANIRFGFTFAITDDLQVGIGRTKLGKVYDLEVKYNILKQKEIGSFMSSSIYFNTAIATRDFPEVGPNEFFADGTTPFEYEFAHRLSYMAQVLLSRKFGEKFSLEFNPTMVYKNLVPDNYKNTTIGTTLGARFKTGITSSIIFEYTTKFNNRLNDFKDPLSIGYEIGTAGHAFQMFISSTNQIILQVLYFSSPLDYTDGKMVIGFNIKRTFRNANSN